MNQKLTVVTKRNQLKANEHSDGMGKCVQDNNSDNDNYNYKQNRILTGIITRRL